MSSPLLNSLLAVACVLTMCTTTNASQGEVQQPTLLGQKPSETAISWVDSVYNTMTLKQQVAQLFVPRLDISDNASGRSQLSSMVKAGVGGFLLGKGTVTGYANLIQLAQSEAAIPLMVTLDGEWGLSMRVSDTPRFPYNMGLGAIQDPQLLYDYGAEVARECRAMGIQVDFAPVLDVNSNPSNPVIGYRSFGEDPKRVSALGLAYSKGMESMGVMSVAKHFPGHGDTSTDSHKALPTITHSRSTLDEVDLLPFRDYINAGLSGIMVGHLCIPAIDNSGAPASMSSKIVTDLLGGELGFKGLVWTDALAMKGANSSENNCVRALQAGVDVLLGSGSPLNDINAVIKAVESGKISKKVIEERCKKILTYKYQLGLNTKPKAMSAEQIKKAINAPEAEDVNRRLSAASITCLWNKTNLLPLRNLEKNKIAVVSIGSAADNDFSRTCKKYANVAVYGAPKGSLTSAQLSAISHHDIVIAAVFSDSKAAQATLSRLSSVKNLVPVFFINPYKMAKYATSIKQCPSLVTAYDNTRFLREYAAQAIFGGIKVDGTLPVNLKGLAPLGTGVVIDKSRLGYDSPANAGVDPGITSRIDNLVDKAISAGAFPGCQVVVARGGDVIIDRAYGNTTRAKGGVAVSTETLYDIASMTKATATTGGIMKAVDEGLIKLDDRVADYLPGTDSLPVGKIKIRELLTHESGLPARFNIYTYVMDDTTYSGKLMSSRKADPYTIKIEDGLYGHNKARLRSDLFSREPSDTFCIPVAAGLYARYSILDSITDRISRIKPGAKKYEYSDLNFCLLMAIEEAATDVAHDQWVDLELFQPLGAWHTTYNAADSIPLTRIAPTETDNFLRRQQVHGYTHDEIGAFSGGVQGNAGLFSTAGDIAKYCQMLLNGGVYGGDEILSPATVKTFTTTSAAGGRRALGFDRKAPSPAPSGTYGHTGFTGTCFWVDPKNDLIFVFLSNRVNPSRNNSAWSKSSIRGKILAEIYQSLK